MTFEHILVQILDTFYGSAHLYIYVSVVFHQQVRIVRDNKLVSYRVSPDVSFSSIVASAVCGITDNHL